MNDAPPPSSSSDTMVLVRGGQLLTRERWFRHAPLAQLVETMNDGPSPFSSSDPIVLVRGSQNAISLAGLRRRSHSYGHMEDYGPGPLIQYLHSAGVSYSLNDMIRCRTPAAHSAVDAIPTVKITQKHLSIDPQCAVCLDLFEFGGEAREMPCMHMYHADYILPWLAQNNSCPVCRHKFPVEEECDRRNSESSSTSSFEARGDLIFSLPGCGFAIGSSPRGSTGSNDASTSRNPSVVIRGGGFVSDLHIREENQGQSKRTSLSFLWPFRSSNSNSESSSSSSDSSSSSSNSGNIASSSGGSSRW
ncbi:hypothetical protein KI387_015682 [Taxus chinensis]|uniref:RING-type E3 ubiquitin transferase n=1 Tax=Taxus chinensis TaxID=29808 RepID=A0AA38GGB2_TAXCH|nr:hypothetical protein KI387_015682 [Taxus chinensis]